MLQALQTTGHCSTLSRLCRPQAIPALCAVQGDSTAAADGSGHNVPSRASPKTMLIILMCLRDREGVCCVQHVIQVHHGVLVLVLVLVKVQVQVQV